MKRFFTGRRRANEFLKEHDVFRISAGEYWRDCNALERSFAGVVLGRCRDGIEAKIIGVGELDAEGAESLSLGRFGEITYQSEEIWHKTGFFGFMDHLSRVWCCGKIADSILHGGEYFFPHCIEPVFETLFFAKRAKLFRDESGAPGIAITLRIFFRLKIFRRLLLKNLFSFAARFEKTKKLAQIVIDA